MQYNIIKEHQKYLLTKLNPALPFLIKQQPSPHLSKDKSKLPLLEKSKDHFLLQLIKQEQNTNQLLTNRSHKDSFLQALTPRLSIHKKGKATSKSSAQLKPKEGKLFFSKDSPHKIKRKYLIQYIEQKRQRQPNKEKLNANVNKERIIFYNKRRDGHSSDIDKHSQTLIHLFEKMENIKKLYDKKRQPSKEAKNSIQEQKQKTIQFPPQKNSSKISINELKTLNKPKSDRIREHIHTCIHEADRAQQIQKYSKKLHHLTLFKQKKTKIALVKPLEPRISQLYQEKLQQLPKRAFQGKIEPWSSQYPLEIDEAVQFLY